MRSAVISLQSCALWRLLCGPVCTTRTILTASSKPASPTCLVLLHPLVAAPPMLLASAVTSTSHTVSATAPTLPAVLMSPHPSSPTVLHTAPVSKSRWILGFGTDYFQPLVLLLVVLLLLLVLMVSQQLVNGMEYN